MLELFFINHKLHPLLICVYDVNISYYNTLINVLLEFGALVNR